MLLPVTMPETPTPPFNAVPHTSLSDGNSYLTLSLQCFRSSDPFSPPLYGEDGQSPSEPPSSTYTTKDTSTDLTSICHATPSPISNITLGFFVALLTTLAICYQLRRHHAPSSRWHLPWRHVLLDDNHSTTLITLPLHITYPPSSVRGSDLETHRTLAITTTKH
jgi:hypothetical protein